MKSETQKKLDILMAALQPDNRIKEYTRQWLLIAAMNRTMSSIEKNGKRVMCHELSNEEYLDHVNEINPLKDFIAQRQKWAKEPYGVGSSSKASPDDVSEFDAEEILDKFK